MAISDLGRQFICYNFGDASHCCIKTGLSWYYMIGATQYNETGGTAQAVSRLASGLVDSLTMTSPATGTFTQTQLNTANGQTITLSDCQTITLHDELGDPDGQWCFIPCTSWTDETACEYYGCFWYNGTCHSIAPSCGELNNQIDCNAYGCYWYNNSCHSTPPTCSDLQSSTECTLYGCHWWNGSCHSAAPSCEQLLNSSDCSTYGCYWYHNGCHSADQPQLCYWIDSKGGATGLDITEIFQLIDCYLYNIPPTGYTFIPTITNVMGIIDYYLGFIDSGDTKTGCNY